MAKCSSTYYKHLRSGGRDATSPAALQLGSSDYVSMANLINHGKPFQVSGLFYDYIALSSSLLRMPEADGKVDEVTSPLR